VTSSRFLKLFSYSEQTVDIVNRPGMIKFVRDYARVSLRTCNRNSEAVKYMSSIMGSAHQHVPSSRTWKLWEHEVCDVILLSGSS